MTNPPLPRRTVRALAHFAAEHEALLAHLEHDRLRPLPADIAHRGRAALAAGARLLATRHKALPPLGKPLPAPDAPFLPADLFIALICTETALAAEFASELKALRPNLTTYPRASGEA